MSLGLWSCKVVLAAFSASVLVSGVAKAQSNTGSTVAELVPGHLRLVDNLDRPEDGYCLDILGSGQYIRFDMPFWKKIIIVVLLLSELMRTNK